MNEAKLQTAHFLLARGIKIRFGQCTNSFLSQLHKNERMSEKVAPRQNMREIIICKKILRLHLKSAAAHPFPLRLKEIH